MCLCWAAKWRTWRLLVLPRRTLAQQWRSCRRGSNRCATLFSIFLHFLTKWQNRKLSITILLIIVSDCKLMSSHFHSVFLPLRYYFGGNNNVLVSLLFTLSHPFRLPQWLLNLFLLHLCLNSCTPGEGSGGWWCDDWWVAPDCGEGIFLLSDGSHTRRHISLIFIRLSLESPSLLVSNSIRILSIFFWTKSTNYDFRIFGGRVHFMKTHIPLPQS